MWAAAASRGLLVSVRNQKCSYQPHRNKMESLARDSLANKWHIWDSNPDSPASVLVLSLQHSDESPQQTRKSSNWRLSKSQGTRGPQKGKKPSKDDRRKQGNDGNDTKEQLMGPKCKRTQTTNDSKLDSKNTVIARILKGWHWESDLVLEFSACLRTTVTRRHKSWEVPS